jgi:hypothetical protein
VNHHGNIETEKPLIINPVQDNPAQHLEFKKEFVKAKTPKGTETIKRTGIDRNSLDEVRREKMLAIKGQLQLLKLLDAGQIQNPEAQEVISNLRKLVTPQKPFFAMLRDNFKTDLSKFGINI